MKTVAWLTVDFAPGSGGHRTIFQNLNFLASKGYQCDLYVYDTADTPDRIRDRIESGFFALDGNIYANSELTKTYDIAIATFYSTAKKVANTNAKHKVYFAQDYEPWFFPMSESKLEAELSYGLGLQTVTIGNWLSNKISQRANTKASSFSFCADLDSYKKLNSHKKENAICCVFQPEKPRRCPNMVLKTAQLVRQLRPETKVYLFGSEKKELHNLDATQLGVLSVKELNELYNSCLAGLCISSSNPSRVPFEMMASGLPVVDLYRENNLYDFPDSGCLLSEPTPESLATALIEIIDNNSLRKKLSDGGEKFMQNFPIKRGFAEFGNFIETLDETTKNPTLKNKTYTKKTICASPKVASLVKLEDPYVTTINQTTAKQTPPSLLTRAKRKAIRILTKSA